MAEQNQTNNQRSFKGPRRGHGPMMGGEKAKDFKGTIGKLFRYIGKYKAAVVVVAIFAIGSTVFNVVCPKVLGKATTALSEGIMNKITGNGGIDFTYIGKILLFCLGLYVLSVAFSFVQGFIMTGITQKVCYRMRREVSEKINRMPMSYFESRTYGEVLSRITNDIDTMGNGLNQSITQLITSVSTVIGVIVMMLTISPLMTLISVLILPISIMLMMFVIKKSQRFFKQQQEYVGHINGQVEEVYGGHNVIKAFNKENDVRREFHETNETLYKSAWKSQFFSGLMQPIMMFVGNLGYVAVAISGAALAIRGTIQIGDIQAFIQYVKNLTQPVQQVAQVTNMMQQMAAAAERVFELLEEKEEEQIVENPVSTEGIKGEVTFEHVKFGYNPDQIIIKDFSAHVKPGQQVAIVGPTGAGKTTMVKLLMRFYDVNGGAILLDGHNIKDFNRRELRDVFGMVLQDTWLFKGTIMENIRYGRLDATDEEVIAAAKAAHAHRFISALPGGYNMELNEEITNISQGQKQLLTIARAILADNPVLILDEATSSVDTRTEHRIQRAMDNLMKGRTSFVIAHRLSTIKNADIILVMKDGDIIEQGNHDELMAQNGFYADLYNSQWS
ncbi:MULTISPECIES: ABC transporter ATP-binding protein [Coprococcus]|mgnify:FL=1|jgi:ATP-binding cassette subfamily B multidrug efflux pump|uniref:ABC transporter n=1 Tax=Coprococcus eutactus TaxID=33043 RepID=A0AAI9K5X5_9FIRM|nr:MULTISPECIES: ABC transporter ATP-binding protein [Coprococcus]NSJ92093.1 ABC transporter ATP-binding protein [Coprococcus sp. MSK.21.13]MCU6723325.1 ABC transporter ATP-binding protein/permease [Coprococcus aceti]CBK82376.1 ABC-type multidrug transport system, ATPase and permease components [Coprococcus sp. ART55/1]CUO51582.1 Probable multidrug resistance ABC transporter ATP-binding/permease protein YheH [Coprococcus eutactus]CUO53859.1 Probable multidrug resistance ABC transporter ATP-bin